MKKITIIISIALIIAILIVGFGTLYNPQPKSFTVTSKATLEGLLTFTNRERAKVGIPPLILSPSLSESAQLKANDMNINNYFGHVNPITGKHGYEFITDQCSFDSENILKRPSPTSKDSIQQWMDSPPHKEALLNPRYETVGFGISGNFVVQHFCDIN